jgi:hypothetical protein
MRSADGPQILSSSLDAAETTPKLDLAPGPHRMILRGVNAMEQTLSGCRDFNGPVPQSLLMKARGSYGTKAAESMFFQAWFSAEEIVERWA